ncbi:MAG: 3-isopropylmalate dehydrogenase [Fimbriimonadales bacterium]|nr:3-isopropylmalate dehydrogenase [Fimbriimonadales bacterium]
MPFKVAVLPGDGIGPEVTTEAIQVLRSVTDELEFDECLIGGAAYDAVGKPLPETTLKICKESNAVLLGAVGGPKWDKIEPPELRPEVGALLPLRRELNLYANLRPARIFPALIDASPVRFGPSGPIDCIVVRELTGGIYFGKPRERRDNGEVAVDTCVYSKIEIRRIARRGFEIARQRRRKLHCVDKANVLETSRLWREVVTEVAEGYQDVDWEFMLVDNCAMQLVRDPGQFDVILTENMFGDILSDEAAQVTGSLGMLPSASLSDPRGDNVFGMYEPAHGSAPDIAGQGIANPIATILSAAMMLRFSFDMKEEAEAIERAVSKALDSGLRTLDLGGNAGTKDATAAILANLA